jgi:spermidine/putrescine transport system substrate-binding protein
MLRKWLMILFFSLSTAAFANDSVVNVFVWSNYIPKEVIDLFEKETHIKVNLSEYDGNEELYAKLKANPNGGYDVVIPSSYYIQRMSQEGMLQHIDKTAVPNHRYINPLLLNKTFDPHNQYSFPYLWGTTGIGLDTRYWDPKTIHRWSDLWQPRFKNQLLLYNDSREVFAIAMIVLGYSINESDPNRIHEAYQRLRLLIPNVRLFSTGAATNVFADDDATIGMAESGDIVRARLANPYLVYIYPKDGFAIWEDCLAIPARAPHVQNAERFIDFLMRPKIAAIISLIQGYASPNIKARQFLPKKARDNPLLYPDAATLKRGQMEEDVPLVRALYLHYWEWLKLS